MIQKIKSNEPLYRALRTFIQAVVGYLTAQVMVTGFDNFDKKAIITLIASAISAGISAVMNLNKNPNSADEVD